MKGLLAGIDVGSTNTRCVLYNLEGRAVAQASMPTRDTYVEKGSRRFWDFELLFYAVAKACRMALERVQTPYKLLAVGVAAVGCVSVFLGKDGRPIYAADGDGSHKARHTSWMEEYSAGEYFKITGYPREHNTAMRMLAIGAGNPEVFEELDCILTVSDYIAYRLTGEKAIAYSTADSMAFWDWRTDDWWYELTNAANVPSGALLKARPGGELLGGITVEASELTGFPAGLPVCVGAHDYISAAFACAAEEKGTILNVTGTYDMLTTFSVFPARTDLYRPGVRAMIDHTALSDGASFTMECNASGQLEWLRRNLFTVPGSEEPAWEAYFDGLEQAGFYGRELMLPQIFGRMVPDTRPQGLTAAFLGLSAKTGTMDFFRGVVTGLAFQTRIMFEQLLPACDGFRKFIQIGGAGRSPAWCRLKAAVLGVPITVPNVTEATAMGAALLAGISCGEYGSKREITELTALLGGTVFEPDLTAHAYFSEVYDKIFLAALAEHERYDKEHESILNKYMR